MNSPYENYSCTEFLTDDYFVDHQLQPTDESENFWNQWLAGHPDKLAEWQQAVYLLEAVQQGFFDYAKTYLSDALIVELLEQINKTNSLSEKKIFKVQWLGAGIKWAVAACLLLGVGAGAVWWTLKKDDSAYTQHTASLESKLTEKSNTTNTQITFTLPDGSKIDLAPDSKLAYSQNFNQQDRRVFLTGQATFEVKKDVGKPFLVFANKVVTRVLGTRFKVRAYDQEKEVKIDVESGQVSVFQEIKNTENSHSQYGKGLVLLPNQQAVFSRQTEEFNKTLVKNPLILSETKPEETQLAYDEIPISTVFSDLEKAYGIPIRFNKEGLAGCELSATFSNLSFEQKLEIICTTVQATYQQLDGQIIINGGSCQ